VCSCLCSNRSRSSSSSRCSTRVGGGIVQQLAVHGRPGLRCSAKTVSMHGSRTYPIRLERVPCIGTQCKAFNSTCRPTRLEGLLGSCNTLCTLQPAHHVALSHAHCEIRAVYQSSSQPQQDTLTDATCENGTWASKQLLLPCSGGRKERACRQLA